MDTQPTRHTKNVSQSLFLRGLGMKRSINGKRTSIFRTTEELPSTFLDERDSANNNVISLCRELHAAMSESNWCTEPRDVLRRNNLRLYNKIHRLLQRVVNKTGISTHGGAQPTKEEVNAANTFCMFGGPDILIEFCRRTMPPSMGGINDSMQLSVYKALGVSAILGELNRRTMFYYMSNIWNECLGILREICAFCPDCCIHLGKDDAFLTFLFKMMSCVGTFTQAVNVCEELIANREEDFALRHVTNLRSLVQTLSTSQFALFTRILSLAVFEASERTRDVSQVLQSVELIRQRKKKMTYGAVDENHRVLLSIPELVPRLVHLVRVTVEKTDLEKGSPDMEFLQTVSNFQWLLLIDVEVRGKGDVSAIAELEEQGSLQRERQLHPLDKYASQEGGGADAPPVTADQGADLPEQAPAPSASRTPSLFRNVVDMLRRGNLNRTSRDGEDTDSDDDSTLAQMVDWRANAGDSFESMAALELFANFRGQDDRGLLSQIVGQMLKDTKIRNLTLEQHFIEVLFVLSTLISDRLKNIFQDRVVYHGLVEALYLAFDKLDWTSLNKPHAPERIHGPRCECVPESALKMQYLRLCHNILDRDAENTSNKRWFLSRQDEEEAGLGDGNLPPLAPCALKAKEFKCRAGEFGLLHRITKLLIELPPEADYPFWITTCIEGFMRGATSAERTMLCRWGLLDFLVNSILSPDFKGVSAMQTNYDVLGECLKRNREGFMLFVCSVPEERVEKLLTNAANHLIESNVFLRTVILSLEHFHNEDLQRVTSEVLDASISDEAGAQDDTQPLYPFSSCPAYRWLKCNRISLLHGLMTCVAVDTVSQENVCCINTSLVLLMFAHRRGELADTLRQVAEFSATRGNSGHAPAAEPSDNPSGEVSTNSVHVPTSRSTAADAEGKEGCCESGSQRSPARPPVLDCGPLLNFRQLLWLWEQYYSLRDRDCRALSHSSGIDFDEWVQIVHILCGRVDAHSNGALVPLGTEEVDLPKVDLW